MSIKSFKYFDPGIELRDLGSDYGSVEGQVFQNAGKIKAYLGSAIREIITNSQSQTLTNKTFDSDLNTLSNVRVSNLASGVLDTDLTTVSASDDTLPSAKATQTYVTTHKNTTSGIHGVTGNVVGTSDSQTLTNKTIDAASNTISNIVDGNVSNSASIARYKLASGVANALQANSGTGVISDVTDITVGTHNFTLANSKHIETQVATDSTTTGSNASLTAFNGGFVRLTNASLVSLANIPAGSDGQLLSLVNRTGNSITIVDSVGAVGTAADRILTGSNSNYTMVNNSSLELKYDITSARWQALGLTATPPAPTVLTEVFNLTVLNATGATSLTGVAYFKAPANITISNVVLQIYEKGSIASGSLTMDLKQNTTPNNTGMTSIFSTLPTINFATASDYATNSGTINVANATVASGSFVRLDFTSIPAGLGKIIVQVYGQ